MPDLTIKPGVLQVASAFPDPPFEVETDGTDTGFDAELMQSICRSLGLTWRLIKYSGDDFNGIFDGLAGGSYDAVISGTTITPERERVALFSAPYLEFNQGRAGERSERPARQLYGVRAGHSPQAGSSARLAVNAARTPDVKSIDDLRGHIVGIQTGNTSDIVARKLAAEGAIKAIKYYPYHGITDALDDLSAGTIGALIKLSPVLSWLVKDRPGLAVVQEIPTHEQLGIAFAKTNVRLCSAVNTAFAGLKSNGHFDALCRKWLGRSHQG